MGCWLNLLAEKELIACWRASNKSYYPQQHEKVWMKFCFDKLFTHLSIYRNKVRKLGKFEWLLTMLSSHVLPLPFYKCEAWKPFCEGVAQDWEQNVVTRILLKSTQFLSLATTLRTDFLLLQTRVVCPPEKERNFHIFYQLLYGITQEERGIVRRGCISNLLLVQSNQFQDLNNNSPHCLPYIFWNLRTENLVLNQEISLNIIFFVHFSSHFFRLDWLYNTGLPQLAFLLFIFFS